MSHAYEEGFGLSDYKRIALDIERTGPGAKDVTIAIGMFSAKNGASEGTQKKFCVDLDKMPNETWRELWVRRGFDMNTYDEFWSKNIDMLELFQSGEDWYATEKEMTDAFAQAMAAEQFEPGYKSEILFDTVHYDSCYIQELLSRYGHRALHVALDGTFARAWDVNSYQAGAAGVCASDSRDERRKKIAAMDIKKRPNNHDPSEDAKNIYNTFIQTSKFCKRQIKRRRVPSSDDQE